jgi:hypothetical protein
VIEEAAGAKDLCVMEAKQNRRIEGVMAPTFSDGRGQSSGSIRIEDPVSFHAQEIEAGTGRDAWDRLTR